MANLGVVEGLLTAKAFGILVAIYFMAKGGNLKWFSAAYGAVVVWNLMYFL